MTKPLILIVEDEPPLAEMLRYNLEKSEFSTRIAITGEEALHWVEVEIPDLAIVDWMLPDSSGIDFCRAVRKRSDTRHLPIIMLTARGEESDRVMGLEVGADDYVIKPYSPREMIARVQAQLRRNSYHGSSSHMVFADVDLDLDQRRVTRGGNSVHLSPTCFKLLETLMQRPGYVYSRERLLSRVWGSDVYVELRTVDVHIRRLREALQSGGGPDLIRTVRGTGYALDEIKS